MNNKKEIVAFIKFGITGVLNTVIDFIVFTVLTSLFSFNMYLAQFLGYGAGMINSYIINRSWTFKTKEKALSPQLVKFVVVNLVTIALSFVLLGFFTEKLFLTKTMAKLITTVFTTVFNFVFSRVWVFNKF